MSRTKKHKLTGAKAVSHSCENHGACEWCRRNRTYNELRDKEKAEYDEKEFRNNNAMTEADINKIVHLAKVEFCRNCWCGVTRNTCTSLGTCDEHDAFSKAFRKQLMDITMNHNSLIYQDSNAYRIGRKDGYDEIMSQMSDIIGKCYNTGYKDAMDFVCEWLTVNSGLPLHYEEYQKYHEEFLDNLRKAMIENLCNET